MTQLYRLLSEAIDWSPDEPRIVEIADVLERLMFRAVEAGDSGAQGLDDPFMQLMDAAMSEASPISGRILTILERRGWKGWTRIEQAPTSSAPGGKA